MSPTWQYCSPKTPFLRPSKVEDHVNRRGIGSSNRRIFGKLRAADCSFGAYLAHEKPERMTEEPEIELPNMSAARRVIAPGAAVVAVTIGCALTASWVQRIRVKDEENRCMKSRRPPKQKAVNHEQRLQNLP